MNLKVIGAAIAGAVAATAAICFVAHKYTKDHQYDSLFEGSDKTDTTDTTNTRKDFQSNPIPAPTNIMKTGISFDPVVAAEAIYEANLANLIPDPTEKPRGYEKSELY
ncbi:MAG: hypothetical protein RSC68_16970 [Acinetobacter sp.]